MLNSSSSNGSLKNELEDLLTTEQLAEYLKLSPAAVRNMTSSGQLPYYKLGRRNRYSLNEIKALLLTKQKGGS
jgi:excisionase family DNA binding protein